MSTFTQKLILAFLRVSSWLPLGLARGLGRLVARLAWHLNPRGRGRHITEVNIRHCYPELPTEQQQHLACQSFLSLAENIMEMGTVWVKPVDSLMEKIVDIEGKELLLSAISRKKGLIVLGPHLGNWEVLGPYLSLNHTTTILFSPSGRTLIDDFMQQVRERSGANLVPTDQRGIVKLMKGLKQGHVTGVLPDQLPNERTGGDYAPFFGHRVLTTSLAMNMLRRTGAEAVFGFAQRVPGGFKIVFREVLPELYSEDVETALAAMNQGVEACIAECPEQYSWEYKRFRDRPSKRPTIYDRV